MLKEKALRTIKAEFKEYKQRILTNLSKVNILELLYSYFLKYEYTDVEDWQNMEGWIKECLEKEGNLNDK